MTENFAFVASCICLLVGITLCFLPANRYRKTLRVGAIGSLFLLCGVVLMTTFKWTEVAIKISKLEVKLSEAQKEATSARVSLAMVQRGITQQAKNQALEAVLTTYSEVARVKPTSAQVSMINEALKAANVTIVPTAAFNGIEDVLMQPGQVPNDKR